MKTKIILLLFFISSLNCDAQSCHAKFSWEGYSAPTSFTIPDTIMFIDSSINAVTWHWNFGDGDTSTLQSPIHSYNATGLYNVCLTITDGGTCSDSICDSVWVTTCYTDFAYVPTTQLNTIKFLDMPSNVPYYPSHYHWDFGDLTTSNLRLPVHIYNSAGIYHVCLTAYDSSVYCIYGICKDINVSNPHNVKISVCDGNWTDTNTWNTLSVPNTNDTVLIFNNVVLNKDVTIKKPGLLYIEENSSLCGHQSLTSIIMTYGILNVDTLIICNSDTIDFSFSYTDFIPINSLNMLQIGCTSGPSGWETQYFPTSNPFSCNNPPPCYTGLTDYISNYYISIYPNPAINNLTIEAPPPATIEITNIEGQVIKQQTTNVETTNFVVSALAKGMYFVKVKTEKGVAVKKFIKE